MEIQIIRGSANGGYMCLLSKRWTKPRLSLPCEGGRAATVAGGETAEPDEGTCMPPDSVILTIIPSLSCSCSLSVSLLRSSSSSHSLAVLTLSNAFSREHETSAVRSVSQSLFVMTDNEGMTSQ